MSTRGWKEFRRRRKFPVTRSLITNRVPFCTLKRRVFGKFYSLLETFVECQCETTCREPLPEHAFVESLADIDRRKVVEVVRLTRYKNGFATHFSSSLRNPWRDLAGKRTRLSLFRTQPHLPNFIQIHPTFQDLLAKTTFHKPDRYNIRRSDTLRNAWERCCERSTCVFCHRVHFRRRHTQSAFCVL